MAGTLLDLADRMEALADSIKEQTSELAVTVAYKIVVDLVNNTPVDTSAALSNWVVNLSSGARFAIPPHVPGEKGSTRGASMQEALASAMRVLKAKKPGQAVWITNNIDYIVDLNNGSSRQNPGGFVERAVAIGHRNINGYRFKL